jgi:hypothetical protein
VRWPIAREELMTAAANASTAAAPIANGVARLIALSDHAASNEKEITTAIVEQQYGGSA